MNPFEATTTPHQAQQQSQYFFMCLVVLLVWMFYTNFFAQVPRFGISETVTFQAQEVAPQAAIQQRQQEAIQQLETKEANPYAPVAISNINPEAANAYIKRFAPVAVGEMKKYGIPASISLAQGLVESAAGTSRLARKNNNHFGIKCFSKKCKKGHCTRHTDDHHKDFFRKFEKAWTSWRYHSRLLCNKRYKPLHRYGTNYQLWAQGLKEKGYATDPNYDKKLITAIEQFQLYRYDQ